MNPHRLIIFTSLLAAIVCLPFSVVGCHTAIGIFLVAWCMEGRWGTKWSIFANNSLIWIFLVFFIIHISGLFNSDNIDQAWFNLEKKITLLILPLTLSTTLSLQKSDIAMLIKGFVAGCLVAAGSCVLMAMNHYPGERQINFDSHTLFSYSLQNPDSSQTWMNLSYISLASGIDMHPTFLAYYILFAACILYEGLEDQKSGWLTPLTSFLLIIF
ncbi:MAG: hypothetical protein JST14_09055, partial [Bacteroidetes bacterium]|nr:hypothetical protein [Bacteroidota bacterium]